MREEKIYDYQGSKHNFYDINFIILLRAMRYNKKIPPLGVIIRRCAYQGVRNVTFSENFAYALNG